MQAAQQSSYFCQEHTRALHSTSWGKQERQNKRTLLDMHENKSCLRAPLLPRPLRSHHLFVCVCVCVCVHVDICVGAGVGACACIHV